MDQLGDFRVFVCVADVGGVSAAADHLHLAKSAVSRRIKSLEAAASADLFHRGPRGLELTEAGRLLYDRATRIVEDVEDALVATRSNAATVTGTIRLNAPLSFSLAQMSDVIADFTTAHPQIRFDIQLSDRMVDLFAENRDVALRIGGQLSGDLMARKLTPIRIIVCASSEYWDRVGRPTTPEDLSGHTFLQYGNRSQIDTLVYRAAGGSEHAVRVRVGLTIDNGDMLRDLAIRGLGAISTPTFIVADSIRRGDLEPVLADVDWAGAHLYAVYPRTRRLPRRVRTFIDFLAARFRNGPMWEDGLPGWDNRPVS